MSKVIPAPPFKQLSGKISQHSDTMIITNSFTGESFSRRIGKRDLENHPVTNREKELHSKMHDGIMAYHNLKDNVEGYATFLETFRQAQKEGYVGNAYQYFMHLYMTEGKNTKALKYAKQHSSESDFVKGLQMCDTQADAINILVSFIDKLGYHSLVQTYKQKFQK